MKLIELHILQSFPVSCLNRDDVGSPKTAVFGGVNRARLSSQCMKHAIRLYARDLAGELFAGERTRKAAQDLTAKLIELDSAETKAKEIAEAVCHGFLSKTAPKKKKKGKEEVTEGDEETESDTSTLLYFSPSEIQRIAEAITAAKRANPETKDFQEIATRAVGKAQLKDAADIAVFGRMVANETSLTLEGAGMFSHALSTHKAENELDFWTAVDDSKQVGDDAGAANMGTIEFTSAVYYRYAALNLTMLADDRHLKALSVDGLRKVVDTFIRATLMAVPGARKNSMNAHTLPSYVLGTFKSAGQPVQLINAFEAPIRPKSGLLDNSIEAMKAHHSKMKETWGITCDTEVILPDVNLNAFCEALTKYVA
jgi:CRISPR system Cascade subunit CasC